MQGPSLLDHLVSHPVKSLLEAELYHIKDIKHTYMLNNTSENLNRSVRQDFPIEELH